MNMEKMSRYKFYAEFRSNDEVQLCIEGDFNDFLTFEAWDSKKGLRYYSPIHGKLYKKTKPFNHVNKQEDLPEDVKDWMIVKHADFNAWISRKCWTTRP